MQIVLEQVDYNATSRHNEILDWKIVLVQVLKKLDLIKDKETGKLVINLNQGGITAIEKTVIFK